MQTSILQNLKRLFDNFESGKVTDMRQKYKSSLFRMDKPSTFKDVNSKVFTGYIRGVSKVGNLIVELEDSILKEYAFKELELLY